MRRRSPASYLSAGDWNGGGNAVRPDYVNDTHLFLRHLVVGTYA